MANIYISNFLILATLIAVRLIMMNFSLHAYLLFVYLFWLSVSNMFKYFAQFLVWLFVLLLSFDSSFYILDTIPLSDVVY